MADKYFQAPCKIRTTTRAEDLKADDFVAAASAEVEGDGEFTITLALSAKQPFGDVASITQSGNVQIFDDKDAESPVGTDAGVNTATDGVLTVSVGNVDQTSSNVGNKWKAVFANLVVVAKDGTTQTIPSLTVKFTSPL